MFNQLTKLSLIGTAMKPQHFRTRLTVFAESHDYSPQALSFFYYFSRPSTMTKSSKTPSDDVLIPWLFLDACIATAHAHPPLDRVLKAILSTCQVWIIILARPRMWYTCCSRQLDTAILHWMVSQHFSHHLLGNSMPGKEP